MRRIEALGGGNRVRFCEVLDHAFLGVLGAARERPRGALEAPDKYRPVGVQLLDLEVHSFVPSVGVLRYP